MIVSLVNGKTIQDNLNINGNKKKLAQRVIIDNIQNFRSRWNEYTPQRLIDPITGRIQ